MAAPASWMGRDSGLAWGFPGLLLGIASLAASRRSAALADLRMAPCLSLIHIYGMMEAEAAPDPDDEDMEGMEDGEDEA